jgi:arginine utilization protein RocB
MKTLLRIASYLFVLAIGLGAGFYLGFRLDQASALAFDMAETGYYAAHMDMQFDEGTDATREEAIHTFLALNEKRKTRPSELFTQKMLATDSALAYARLAAFARKRGAIQEAQQYLNRAASFCPQIGWQECSAQKIVYMVQRLDQKGVLGTPPEK